MSKRHLIPCGLFLCCAFAMALPARAASDIFVQVEGIPGESTDVKHKGWIEVLSFSTGVTQSGAAGAKMGAGGGTGKADIAPFTITKSVDGSTPRLFSAACGGTHIKRVVVEVTSAGQDKYVFLKYTLNDVIVSSVRTSGAGNSDANKPMEEIAFSFAKIEMEYTPQDASGKAGAPVKASWDMTTNKAVSSQIGRAHV